MIAKEHEKAKKKYSVASQATVFRRELNLPEALEPENEVPVYGRNVKQIKKKNLVFMKGFYQHLKEGKIASVAVHQSIKRLRES